MGASSAEASEAGGSGGGVSKRRPGGCDSAGPAGNGSADGHSSRFGRAGSGPSEPMRPLSAREPPPCASKSVSLARERQLGGVPGGGAD